MWFMFLFYLLYITLTPTIKYANYLGSSLSSFGIIGHWTLGIMNYRIAILILGIVLPLIGVMCMFHKAKIPVWLALIPGYNLFRFLYSHREPKYVPEVQVSRFVQSQQANNVSNQ